MDDIGKIRRKNEHKYLRDSVSIVRCKECLSGIVKDDIEITGGGCSDDGEEWIEIGYFCEACETSYNYSSWSIDMTPSEVIENFLAEYNDDEDE